MVHMKRMADLEKRRGGEEKEKWKMEGGGEEREEKRNCGKTHLF